MNSDLNTFANQEANFDANEINTGESSTTSDDLDEDNVKSNQTSKDQNVKKNANKEEPTILKILEIIDVDEEEDVITQVQILSSNVNFEGEH